MKMDSLEKLVSTINKSIADINQGSDIIAKALGLGRGSKLGMDDFKMTRIESRQK
jgi:hypothetical protein